MRFLVVRAFREYGTQYEKCLQHSASKPLSAIFPGSGQPACEGSASPPRTDQRWSRRQQQKLDLAALPTSDNVQQGSIASWESRSSSYTPL